MDKAKRNLIIKTAIFLGISFLAIGFLIIFRDFFFGALFDMVPQKTSIKTIESAMIYGLKRFAILPMIYLSLFMVRLPRIRNSWFRMIIKILLAGVFLIIGLFSGNNFDVWKSNENIGFQVFILIFLFFWLGATIFIVDYIDSVIMDFKQFETKFITFLHIVKYIIAIFSLAFLPSISVFVSNKIEALGIILTLFSILYPFVAYYKIFMKPTLTSGDLYSNIGEVNIYIINK